MSDYTVKDLVQFAAAGDALKTSDAFDNLVADRVIDAITAKKMELAQRIFNNAQETEAETEEEVSSETEEEAHENA